MKWLVCALVFCPSFALQSKFAFKSFYKQGNEFFAERRFQEALDQYKEAYRLEVKAQRYKEEGTFFNNYLPRYRIALCYEQVDILQAEEWVQLSKEALESDVIRRQKQALAEYHRDLERITAAVETFREALKARYDLKLREAENLLAQNKFDSAKTAFEALNQIDASRPEAEIGLGKIAPARLNYLKGKALDSRTAILQKNFESASAILDQIAGIDESYSDLPLLRRELENAVAAAKAAETTTVASKDPEPKRPPPRETNRETVENRPVATLVDRAAERRKEQQRERQRQALKSALLETLKPYRRGDPAAALQKLEEITLENADDSSSYHWLKSLYLLGAYHHAPQPDDSLLERARNEMVTTAKLAPDFQPVPDHYPDYVLEFYQQAKRSLN